MMGNLSGFIAFSIAAHLVALFAAIFVPNNEPTTLSEANTTSISLGMQTALAGAMTQAAPKPASKKIDKTEVEPLKEAKQEPEISDTDLKQAEVIHEEVLEKVDKKKKTEPKLEKHEEVEPIEKTEVQTSMSQPQVQGDMGTNGSTKSTSKIAETGQDQTVDAAALATAEYDVLIRKHILSKKQYPKRLKMKKLKGTVTVTFTLNKLGELQNKELVKLSGVRDFDRAAQKLISQAAPFPAPSSEVDWQTRSYKLDIKYDWR